MMQVKIAAESLLARLIRCFVRTSTPGSIRRSLDGESGSLLVETALALLVVIPMVFWLFELCMQVYTYSVLGDAVRQGVRYAVVHGTDSTNCSGPSTGCADAAGGNVVSVVKNTAALSFHNISSMVVNANYLDDSSAPGSRINITLTYTYLPYIQLPGIANTVNMSAEGRIIY